MGAKIGDLVGKTIQGAELDAGDKLLTILFEDGEKLVVKPSTSFITTMPIPLSLSIQLKKDYS